MMRKEVEVVENWIDETFWSVEEDLEY